MEAGDAHQFCLMQRKAILISGCSGIVILCGRFQNGGFKCPGRLQRLSKCRWAWKSTCTPAQRANKPQWGDLPGSRSKLCFRTEAGAQCGCGYVAPVRPQKITRRPQTAAEPGAAPMSGPIGNRLKLCPKGVGAAALLSLRLKISGPYGAG